MTDFDNDLSRRCFMKGAGAAMGASALTLLPLQIALAAAFPERNISVYVPTREGGGADAHLRAFTGVWKKYLKTNFEASFYPGAAGRVGYETYMGKAPRDCYHLLFGNMGPEVLNWVVKPPTFPLDAYFYFAQIDADPAILFTGSRSKLKSVDDIIAEGKKRTLTVGVSRLAHPASLGALLLATKTGAKFNLIPLSGGRNTRAGVVTGEVDFGALPASTVAGRKQFKVVGLFHNKNPKPDLMKDAVLINTEYNLGVPPLIAGARAFGIQTDAAEKYADRFKILNDTLKKVYDDPDYKATIVKQKQVWEFIEYGGPKECTEYCKYITEIGKEYRTLLTGKTKKS